MFRLMTDFPRCRIDVTLLSDRPPYAVRIVSREDGALKDYAVEYIESDLPDGILEAATFRNGATEYALLTSDRGQHSCSCPNFVHAHEDRPCRHLWAMFVTGIFRRDIPPFLKPMMEIGNVSDSNEASKASQRAAANAGGASEAA